MNHQVAPMKPRKTWSLENLPLVETLGDLEPACAGIDPRHLMVIAGAGVSVDLSWLPTARDFLKGLYKTSLPPGFDWSRLLSDYGPRFELVLDVLQANFDPELQILDVFRSRHPNHNHKCLAALARQGALVVTTNFDVLIEAALAETGTFRSAFNPEHFQAFPKPGTSEYTPTIWHLHGVIEDPESHERQSETIAASIRDIWRSKHLFQLEATKGLFMARALAERDLLVVGYSGSDDYDITPLLTEVASPRKVVWVDHHVFDPAEGPPPSVRHLTFEDDCWYKDPALNALAEMIDQGKRPSEKVQFLKYKSSHVLQKLSGLRDVDDPLDQGPGLKRLPLIRDLKDEEMEDYWFQLSEPHLRDFRLQQLLSQWTERHLSSKASRYLFALTLCKVCGLLREQAILRAALTEEAAANTASAEHRDVAFGMLVAIMASPVKAIPDQLLPFLLDYLDQWRVMSPAEANVEAEWAMFEHYPSQDLSAAEKRANDALSTAIDEENPAVIARASLLLARIAEMVGGSHEFVTHLYEEASKAAYDSASLTLIGIARGEMGIYLWTKFFTLAQQVGPGFVEVEGLVQLARQCVSPLAEAFRVHSEQENFHALQVVCGNLADCLEFWQESLRGLRAHCVALFSSVQIEDTHNQLIATERIMDVVSDLLPELELKSLAGKELAVAILTKLDQLPDSLI